MCNDNEELFGLWYFIFFCTHSALKIIIHSSNWHGCYKGFRSCTQTLQTLTFSSNDSKLEKTQSKILYLFVSKLAFLLGSPPRKIKQFCLW